MPSQSGTCDTPTHCFNSRHAKFVEISLPGHATFVELPGPAKFVEVSISGRAKFVEISMFRHAKFVEVSMPGHATFVEVSLSGHATLESGKKQKDNQNGSPLLSWISKVSLVSLMISS